MSETTVVIVSGLPATGKTTLAHKIGEIIANSIGAHDPSAKGLGTASHLILFYTTKQFLENDLSLVIESNFKDTEHTREFIEYLKASKKRVVEIQCTATYELRVERYGSRKRHPVHPTLDNPEYAKSFKGDENFSLGIGTFLKVDTSDFSTISYQSIFDTVRAG